MTMSPSATARRSTGILLAVAVTSLLVSFVVLLWHYLSTGNDEYDNRALMGVLIFILAVQGLTINALLLSRYVAFLKDDNNSTTAQTNDRRERKCATSASSLPLKSLGCLLLATALLVVVYYLIQCPNFPPLDPGGLGCNDSTIDVLVIAVAFPCSMLAAVTVWCWPTTPPSSDSDDADDQDQEDQI